MSENITVNPATTTNDDDDNNKVPDQLSQDIKKQQEKEISYVLEASQADDKRSKYLAKKNEYIIVFDDGSEETFKRKPLSSRKNKEIDDLRSAFLAHKTDFNSKIKVGDQSFDNINDVLYEAFRRTAMYCLGMKAEQYDIAIWEDDPELVKRDVYGLRSVLAACLLRAVHGIAYFHQP